MDLNPYFSTGENYLWKNYQGYEYWVEDMVEMAATAQDLYIHMATGNHISQASKVGLYVLISK